MKKELNIHSKYDFTQIPFEKIERVGVRGLLYKDLFCVSWILGRFCNYSCSYCWPYAHSKQKDHRPLNQLMNTLDEIKNQARKRGFNSFHFSFSGGEPTLHKDYLNLLKYYSLDTKKCHYQSVHMTSNLSPGLEWLKKYVEITKSLHRASITASFHSEMTRKEIFTEKILFLQENDIHVTINMVMVPKKFDQLWDIALYFHEQHINVTLKPQSNESATSVVEGYSKKMLQRLKMGMPQRNFTKAKLEEKQKKSVRPISKYNMWDDSRFDSQSKVSPTMQIEMTDKNGNTWFIDQAERFNAFDFNSFKGWECSAGYRSIIIREPGGVVKRGYSCNDSPLGNLEEGFTLLEKLSVCCTDKCISSADSKIPKRKPQTDWKLWDVFEKEIS